MQRPEELQYMLGIKPFNTEPNGTISYLEPHNVVIPETMDWRKQGYVTKVKDQVYNFSYIHPNKMIHMFFRDTVGLAGHSAL